MKKTYIAPAMEVYEMEGNEMLCASAIYMYDGNAVKRNDDLFDEDYEDGDAF